MQLMTRNGRRAVNASATWERLSPQGNFLRCVSVNIEGRIESAISVSKAARNKYEEDEMSWFHSVHPDHDKCAVCGGPMTVEMDGPWSYRVCTRNGHRQSQGTGPLADAILLLTARGN